MAPFPSAARQDDDRSSAPQVIVIDDDPAARESFGALLDHEGYETALFASCEDFLAEGGRRENACLLLDTHFPGMSGLDLLDTLRRQGKELPTVFVMGRFDGGLRTRALRFPTVVSVLDKPVGAPDLIGAIRTALAA